MAPRKGPKSRKKPAAEEWTMSEWRPPNPDSVSEAYARLAGSRDPHGPDGGTEQLLTYIFTDLLPAFPAVKAAEFASLRAPDRVDRISLLPDKLLGNIVSRLFVTEAARTAVLASRWRRVWLSTPLVLSDAYISPSGGSRPITDSLARWLELLAAKGVQELVLLNRPLPLDVPLPAALFSVTTLTSLFIGLWKFPDVARFPRGTSFPHLRELGICSVVMEDGDIEAFVARSPVLNVLSIQGSNRGLRLRLVSQSIRCVQVCGSVLESITVSKQCDFEAGSARLNIKFWESAKPTENVKSRITVLSFREFQGEIGEVAFLKYFFRNAEVLEKASISMANPSFTPFCTDQAFAKETKASDKTASKSCNMVVLGSTGPEGGKLWRFKKGADYTFEDPFWEVQMRVSEDGD
ncbi:unnamed protein product [Alopecurus aequalis]